MGTISILQEDISSVSGADFIPWEELKNKTIFLTGTTGLIGSCIARSLDYASRQKNLNLTVLGLVRDMGRAREKFQEILPHGVLKLVQGSVESLPESVMQGPGQIRRGERSAAAVNSEQSDQTETGSPEADLGYPGSGQTVSGWDGTIDYIIHGASQTASREFVSHAVETINTAVTGTTNLLQLAREKKVRGFVYLSSMEVYGYPEKGHKVTEEEAGAFSPLNLRNSYPLGKLMCESLCCAFAKEYGVPAKIIRLTQTFGPGVNYNDTRIFAYIGRCIREKKNIVLKTKGETERCYLYTTDAVTAVLTVLLKGESGTAYNAADENTYCSIAGMAEKVARENGLKVEYDIQPASANGFTDTLYMNLDTSRLKALGWKPIGGAER